MFTWSAEKEMSKVKVSVTHSGPYLSNRDEENFIAFENLAPSIRDHLQKSNSYTLIQDAYTVVKGKEVKKGKVTSVFTKIGN